MHNDLDAIAYLQRLERKAEIRGIERAMEVLQQTISEMRHENGMGVLGRPKGKRASFPETAEGWYTKAGLAKLFGVKQGSVYAIQKSGNIRTRRKLIATWPTPLLLFDPVDAQKLALQRGIILPAAGAKRPELKVNGSYTYRSAAEYLGLSITTVKQMIRQNQIQKKLAPREDQKQMRVLLDAEDIERIKQQREQKEAV